MQSVITKLGNLSQWQELPTAGWVFELEQSRRVRFSIIAKESSVLSLHSIDGELELPIGAGLQSFECTVAGALGLTCDKPVVAQCTEQEPVVFEATSDTFTVFRERQQVSPEVQRMAALMAANTDRLIHQMNEANEAKLKRVKLESRQRADEMEDRIQKEGKKNNANRGGGVTGGVKESPATPEAADADDGGGTGSVAADAVAGGE